MLEIYSSNPPVITGISNPKKSQARHYLQLLFRFCKIHDLLKGAKRGSPIDNELTFLVKLQRHAIYDFNVIWSKKTHNLILPNFRKWLPVLSNSSIFLPVQKLPSIIIKSKNCLKIQSWLLDQSWNSLNPQILNFSFHF